MASSRPENNSCKPSHPRKPGFLPRPLKVAVVGAGASGLCLAYKLLEAHKAGTLGPIDVTIYEKEEDYGGTWHVNRYPGCRCDVPSHVYQFTFAPYASWPEFYSSSDAIKHYLHKLAERFEIAPLIKLRHEVTKAIYKEDTGTWDIAVKSLEKTLESETLSVDIFIPATGVLSRIHKPDIPGLHSNFKGSVLHTAEWPKDLDWKMDFQDKRVAVIGAGSSGIQTVGALAPYCKSLDVYARSKFWISPPFNIDDIGDRDWDGDNFAYTDDEKKALSNDPTLFHGLAAVMSRSNNSYYDIMLKNSTGQETGRRVWKKYMEDNLARDDLKAKLIPEFSIGCRRPTPSLSFLKALALPHVNIIITPISSVTSTSIVQVHYSKMEEHPVDQIILATGFDTASRIPYEFRGKGGVELQHVWRKRQQAYLSLAVAGFPNCFMMGCGPGITYANGTVLPTLESIADYIVDALRKIQKQDIKAMEVDMRAQEEYNFQQNAVMQDLIFTDSCSSWYKNGTVSGPPDAIYAGSTLQFMELLSMPRWEDWNYLYQYPGNRFSFLGDGTGTEDRDGRDRAWYLRLQDFVNPLT